MLKVSKKYEPDFFTKFNELRNEGETYDDWSELDSITKEQLYKHILKNEQIEYCAYCEQKFPYLEPPKLKNYRIEHIWPRSLYPEKTFEYKNLLVTCDNQKGKEKTCDHSKENSFDSELFINPVTCDPTMLLTHSLADGEINPVVVDEDHPDYARATYTIKLLNLNAKRLTLARQELIEEILRMIGEEELFNVLEDWVDTHNFPTLINQILENRDLLV